MVSALKKIWVKAIPAVFVALWATGFIGAKYGLPYAEPMTFLAIRMGLAALALLLFAWPKNKRGGGVLAQRCRSHANGGAGRSFMLWLGGHLFHFAARAESSVAAE